MTEKDNRKKHIITRHQGNTNKEKPKQGNHKWGSIKKILKKYASRKQKKFHNPIKKNLRNEKTANRKIKKKVQKKTTTEKKLIKYTIKNPQRKTHKENPKK